MEFLIPRTFETHLQSLIVISVDHSSNLTHHSISREGSIDWHQLPDESYVADTEWPCTNPFVPYQGIGEKSNTDHA